jgi:hypothetical protein
MTSHDWRRIAIWAAIGLTIAGLAAISAFVRS